MAADGFSELVLRKAVDWWAKKLLTKTGEEGKFPVSDNQWNDFCKWLLKEVNRQILNPAEGMSGDFIQQHWGGYKPDIGLVRALKQIGINLSPKRLIQPCVCLYLYQDGTIIVVTGKEENFKVEYIHISQPIPPLNLNFSEARWFIEYHNVIRGPGPPIIYSLTLGEQTICVNLSKPHCVESRPFRAIQANKRVQVGWGDGRHLLLPGDWVSEDSVIYPARDCRKKRFALRAVSEKDLGIQAKDNTRRRLPSPYHSPFKLWQARAAMEFSQGRGA